MIYFRQAEMIMSYPQKAAEEENRKKLKATHYTSRASGQEDGSARPVDASRPLWREGGRALALDRFNVVGGEHAGLASALHRAVHPALVDGLHVHDDVAVLEGHLIGVGSGIVIHGTHGFLQGQSQG